MHALSAPRAQQSEPHAGRVPRFFLFESGAEGPFLCSRVGGVGTISVVGTRRRACVAVSRGVLRGGAAARQRGSAGGCRSARSRTARAPRRARRGAAARWRRSAAAVVRCVVWGPLSV